MAPTPRRRRLLVGDAVSPGECQRDVVTGLPRSVVTVLATETHDRSHQHAGARRVSSWVRGNALAPGPVVAHHGSASHTAVGSISRVRGNGSLTHRRDRDLRRPSCCLDGLLGTYLDGLLGQCDVKTSWRPDDLGRLSKCRGTWLRAAVDRNRWRRRGAPPLETSCLQESQGLLTQWPGRPCLSGRFLVEPVIRRGCLGWDRGRPERVPPHVTLDGRRRRGPLLVRP